MTALHIYLLGGLLMGLRALWRTRDQRCSCCAEIRKPCVTVLPDGLAYDLRYLVVAICAVFWPITTAAIIAKAVVIALNRGGPDDDDLRPA